MCVLRYEAWYEQVCVLLNLKPAEFKGVKSEGMVSVSVNVNVCVSVCLVCMRLIVCEVLSQRVWY